jgi:hypothetical protein
MSTDLVVTMAHIYCDGAGSDFAKKIASRYEIPFDEVISIDAHDQMNCITIKTVKRLIDNELAFIDMVITTDFSWLTV